MEALKLNKKPATGTTLIEASAGTGKTFSIANLYLHYILQGQKIEEVLVVTFTEAATKELRERLRENLSKAKKVLMGLEEDEIIQDILTLYSTENCQALIETAILNFDQSAIFTIHGFCQRMLKENAFESACLFDAELISDQENIVAEIVNDFWRKKIYTLSEEELRSLSLKRSELTSLCKEILKNPELSIHGSASEEELAQAKKHLVDIKKSAQITKELFLRSEENIQQKLYQEDALKGNIYKAASWSKKRQELLDYLDQPHSSLDALIYFGSKIPTAIKKNKDVPTHPVFNQCTDLEEKGAPKLEAVLKLQLKSSFAQQVQSQAKVIKERLNVLSFDDLIQQLYEALSKEDPLQGQLHARIRDKYKTALVDEFQDTDPKQYQIFNTLFGQKQTDHSFYMIGDPKQSIYAFRGADIFAYLEAKKQADQHYTLACNYRSEHGMVDAVNHFFLSKESTGTEAFAYPPSETSEGIIFDPVQAAGSKRQLKITGDSEALQLRWYLNPEDMKLASKSSVYDYFLQSTCKEILDLLNLAQAGQAYFVDEKTQEESKLKPADIAILTNSHKQAQDLLNALNSQGVPAVIQKSGNVFDSQEAKDLLRFLTAIAEPKEHNITPLLLSSFYSFTAKSLKERSDEEQIDLLSELIEYQRNWPKRAFLQTFQSFLQRHKIQEQILKKEHGERSLTNLMHLREILHEVESEEGHGLAAIIRFLSEKINSDDRDDERYFQRLETDADAVQIMTTHKSKGLEFPVVFVPFVAFENYKEFAPEIDIPYQADGLQSLHIDPKSENRNEAIWQHRREKLAEQVRKLYVALTRSANRCYLYWGHIKNEPSIFTFLSSPAFSAEVFTQKGNDSTYIKADDLDIQFCQNHWQNILAKNPNVKYQEFSHEAYPALQYQAEENSHFQEALNAPSFESHWQIGSYSGLTRSHHKVQINDELHNNELPGLDEDNHENHEPEEVAQGFFAFPRGANPGVAIHEIFEDIDFQDSSEWPAVIEEKLQKYRLAGDEDQTELLKQRINDCQDMLKTVIDTDLAPQNFALKDLSRDQRLDEMEFYFPVNNIRKEELIKIFQAHYPSDHKNAKFAEDLQHLNYQMQEGFLNGSIDLAFEHDDKYYVLDWKSNHLGNKAEDYHTQALSDKIRESFYFLQYHLYTLALHLHLEQNLEGYDYDTHFGGVFYAFIRGFKNNSDHGIHWDRLPKGIVLDMQKLFIEKTAGAL